MSETIVIRGARYEVCDCRLCGAIFTVLEIVRDHQRKSGGYSHCPNGHLWGWSKDDSEDSRIRRERDLLKQQMAQKDDELRWQAECTADAERRASKAKAETARLKKRASAGVCPCCNRTFKQLVAHMKQKHPAFKADDATAENVVSIDKAKRA